MGVVCLAVQVPICFQRACYYGGHWNFTPVGPRDSMTSIPVNGINWEL